jgi:hypothetical protein
MLLESMGYKRFALDYRMHRQEFEDLYRRDARRQLPLRITENIGDILFSEYVRILKTITNAVMKDGTYRLPGAENNRHGIG